ncbi:MAG: L-aspartate oxidase [Gammaproteobacteria bacterium]
MASPAPPERSDVLVVGSGIAGAAAALEAADRGLAVTVLRRADPTDESASSWAQGGIVARGIGDSPDLLEKDILAAGAGLSWPPAARLLAEEGPPLVDRFLVDRAGVAFDTGPDGEWAFGLEAAHSARRILHVGDATGRAIMEALLGRLSGHPNVTVLSRTAVDLLTFPHHALDPLAVYQPATCHGVYALDGANGRVEPLLARATILATGGLGQVYLNTTNPPGARGDGVAMAHRAGARVVNAQFVQFHPTALDMPGHTKLLISEALRGEGARLLTPGGEPFMGRYDPERGELAPRDVVARAIFTEMLGNDWHHVLLDLASVLPAGRIRERFPAIHAACLARGIDITTQPIPVVPAAHYACGGVLVDANGRSTLPGLYAVGEVACTGVHGANRLASTSLLEGLLWGVRAARHVADSGPDSIPPRDSVPDWDDSGLIYDADPALLQGDLQTLRTLMWHYVGVIRSGFRLTRAINELRQLGLSIEAFYRQARLTDALIGLRNAALAGLVVATAAHRDPVSRGCHYREDYPATGPGTPLAGLNRSPPP